jgi:hypothetical protein
LIHSEEAQTSTAPREVGIPGVVEAKWITVVDPIGRTRRQPVLVFYLAFQNDSRRAKAVLAID